MRYYKYLNIDTKQVVGVLQTDDNLTEYRRMDKEYGLCEWMPFDNNTLAIVHDLWIEVKDEEEAFLLLI